MNDSDPTIRIRPPSKRRRAGLWIASGLTALVLAGGLGWFVWSPAPLPPVPSAPPVAARIILPLASEAEILASAPVEMEARRFGPQPEIVIVHFANLGEQARTLNRAAALVERAGFPHDLVLEEAELDRRIRAGGNTPDTLYYGHDYRAADLLRFFAVAGRTGQVLTPDETRLREAMADWGWRDGTVAALISLVRDDPDAGVDRTARATILRHELSHGLYFINAAYAAYARQFWLGSLTEAERALFRRFLAGEGYDTGIEDLMINEAQAYLMHTADPRFFNAGAVGLAPARLDLLRALFLTGMPPSWLRDCTVVPARVP